MSFWRPFLPTSFAIYHWIQLSNEEEWKWVTLRGVETLWRRFRLSGLSYPWVNMSKVIIIKRSLFVPRTLQRCSIRSTAIVGSSLEPRRFFMWTLHVKIQSGKFARLEFSLEDYSTISNHLGKSALTRWIFWAWQQHWSNKCMPSTYLFRCCHLNVFLNRFTHLHWLHSACTAEHGFIACQEIRIHACPGLETTWGYSSVDGIN